MNTKNKRKSQIPPKNQTKSYHKKTNNRHRSKSKSKEANTETSSPTSKTEIKRQNISEILDIKDITEKLGNEILIYTSVNGKDGDLVFRSKPRVGIEQDDVIALEFDTKQVHLFEYDTGKTILRR
jgi:ABC-type sugar transport system ATPase subunit